MTMQTTRHGLPQWLAYHHCLLRRISQHSSISFSTHATAIALPSRARHRLSPLTTTAANPSQTTLSVGYLMCMPYLNCHSAYRGMRSLSSVRLRQSPFNRKPCQHISRSRGFSLNDSPPPARLSRFRKPCHCRLSTRICRPPLQLLERPRQSRRGSPRKASFRAYPLVRISSLSTPTHRTRTRQWLSSESVVRHSAVQLQVALSPYTATLLPHP